MDLKAEARRLAEGAAPEIDQLFRQKHTQGNVVAVLRAVLLAFGRLVREEDAKVCEEIALKSSLGSFRERNTASYCADTIRVSTKSLE